LGYKKYIGVFINSWEIGQGKVFGRVMGAVNFALLLMTWIVVQGFELPFYFLFVFIFVMACLFLVSGFVYEQLGLYRTEIGRYNRINPFNKQVLERLERIEAKLK
jgi:hypothetical protein